MSFARVAYPPPPPTHNALTPAERNNLIRSTKKLGQVLGSTPSILDGSSVQGRSGRPSLTIVTSNNLPSPIQIIDNDLEVHIRALHCRRTPSVSSATTTTSEESTETRFSLSSARSDTDSLTSAESWRPRKVTRKPPPLYQPTPSPSSVTASIKPSLETIPASPSFEAVLEDKAINNQRSISFASFGPPRPLANLPTVDFDIPSEASMRRSKMERLRRKLGDGVPVELVFRDDENTPEELLTQEAQAAMTPSEDTLRWTQQERHRRLSAEVSTLPPSPPSRAVACRPVSISRASSLSPSSLSRSNSTASKSITKASGLTSSFSLQRPLFAVVEADDYVSGCFEFNMRKHRAAYIKEFGKQRAVQ